MGCVSSKKGSLDISSDKAADGKVKPTLNKERYYAAHAGRYNAEAKAVAEPPSPPKQDGTYKRHPSICMKSL